MKKIVIYSIVSLITMLTVLSCEDDGVKVEEDTYTDNLINLRILGPVGLTFRVDGEPPKGASNPYVIAGEEVYVEVINEETRESLLDTTVTPELGRTINLHVFYLGGDNPPEFIDPLEDIEPAREGYIKARFINLTTGGDLQGKRLDLKVYGYDGSDFTSVPEYTHLYIIEDIPPHTFTDFIELPTPETLAEEGLPSVTSEVYDHETGELLIAMEELYPDFFPGFLVGFNGGGATDYDVEHFSVLSYQIKGDDRGETYGQEVLPEMSIPIGE